MVTRGTMHESIYIAYLLVPSTQRDEGQERGESTDKKFEDRIAKGLDPCDALPLPTTAGRYSVDARERSIVAVDILPQVGAR